MLLARELETHVAQRVEFGFGIKQERQQVAHPRHWLDDGRVASGVSGKARELLVARIDTPKLAQVL